MDQGMVEAVECSRKVKTTTIPSQYYTFGITDELKCGKRPSTFVWYLPSVLPQPGDFGESGILDSVLLFVSKITLKGKES